MAIQELHDSMTPLGFYSLIVGIAFLLGLFLGWCLWWWKSRQLANTQELSRAADAEVDELRAANHDLETQIRHFESEQSSISQGGPVHGDQVLSQMQDWTSGSGVDPEIASELKRLGVQNAQQLDSLSASDREALESKLAAAGHGGEPDGEQHGRLAGLKAALAAGGLAGGGLAAGGVVAGGLAAKGAGVSREKTPTDQGDGHRSGISNEGRSHALAAAAPTVSTAGSESSWFANSCLSRRGRLKSPTFGQDGLSKVDNAMAGEFGKSKVARFASGVDSGASLSTDGGSQRRSQSVSDGYTTQRLSDIADENDDQMPVFANDIPHVKDPLTSLDGVDGLQAEELHRMGIHNFDQLHNLSDDDRHRLKAWFRRRGWYLDMDQWRIASEGNTQNPSIEDIQKKAYEIYLYRDREGRHGAENTDWEQAEWALRGNPIFDYGVPHHVDYFVETVEGITPAACDELYRMGLYNMHEVQSLDQDSRHLLTRWFAGPRFKVDLTSAFSWLSS